MKLRALWDKVSTSLWFIPAVMVSGGAILSFLTVAVDRRIIDAPGRTVLLYGGGAEGARAVLGTIASSMMTVAGVVFSITIVALTLASQQFGPRILRNFMEDTGNQIVLGTFIATFVYCLLVARTVRGGDDYQFVPHIAVTGGVLLAIISLGVLIYFIHHVANSIRAETILARVAVDLDAAIDRLYPEEIGEEKAPASWEIDPALTVRTEVVAPHDGYLQAIDHEAVMEIAVRTGTVLKFLVEPSDFIERGDVLVEVYARDPIDDRTRGSLEGAFRIGISRSPVQDVAFPLRQLVEVAVRALSPGVNDPFTAMNSIDRISAGIHRLGRRRFPSALRHDEEGRLRIIAPHKEYEQIVKEGLRPLREAAERSPVVSDYLGKSLDSVGANYGSRSMGA